MLGEVEIYISGNGHYKSYDDRQKIFVSDLNPSEFRGIVDDADGAGTLRIFPDNGKAGNKLGCDVVHHEGEEGVVCVPFCLEIGGDCCPECTADNAGHTHQNNQHPFGYLVRQGDHAGSGCPCTHQNLPFPADVPEAHLKGGGECQCDEQKHGGVLGSDPGFALGAEGSFDHGGKYVERVQPGQKDRDNAAQNKCE